MNDFQDASCSGVAAPPSVSKMTKAGSAPESSNAAAALAACTDSAAPGRNDSWSLDCTVDNEPMAGPPTPAIASQAITTPISPTARSTALRRDGGGCAGEAGGGNSVISSDPRGMTGHIRSGERAYTASTASHQLPSEEGQRMLSMLSILMVPHGWPWRGAS